jgi:hypothetical protein
VAVREEISNSVKRAQGSTTYLVLGGGCRPVFRVAAGMDDTVHVEVQAIELNAVGVGLVQRQRNGLSIDGLSSHTNKKKQLHGTQHLTGRRRSAARRAAALGSGENAKKTNLNFLLDHIGHDFWIAFR